MSQVQPEGDKAAIMRHILSALLAVTMLPATTAVQAQEPTAETRLAEATDSPYRALQALDGQLAAIGYRLGTANAPLCDQRAAATGLQWHDIDQYTDRAAISGVFAFDTPIEVAAVVPKSPADLAGIQVGDAFVALDDTPRVDIKALGSNDADDPYARIRRIGEKLASMSSDGSPVTMEFLRQGSTLVKDVKPLPTCATSYQIRIEDGLDAGADGRMVSVNLPLVQYALDNGEADQDPALPPDDGQLVAVVAHELAHNILRHRERLDAAGVDRGIGRLFGKSAGRIKATEEEADRLSVWLMLNAGYDPEDAVRFWTRFGKEHGLGIFSDSTHYRWKNRVRQLREEMAAAMAADRRNGVLVPPILRAPLPPLD